MQELVSIIVPCYNEEKVLPELLEKLDSLARSVPECGFEFIFVDDGSADGTRRILERAARRDARVRALVLSRNFGQQIAATAGIDIARGDGVVLMDSDLQDPPEVVAEMIARWREGYEIVYGARATRDADSWFKRASARLFAALLNTLTDCPIPPDAGDFRLMSRQVVEVLKNMPERHRFLRGMVAWTGFRQTSVPYDRPERFAGETKYTLRKMVGFAFDGLFSFSTKPLKLSIVLGLLVTGLAVLGIVYALVLRIFTSVWVEGWTLLFIAILLLGGVQLVSLGIIGQYVGRIYSEVQRRPLYVVREMVGFSQERDRAQVQEQAQDRARDRAADGQSGDRQ